MMKTRVTRSANLKERGANFTVQSTADLLRKVLGEQIKLPPVDTLRVFASRMNLIRKNVEIAHILFRDSHALAFAAQNAIPILIAALQTRRETVVSSRDIMEDAVNLMADKPDSEDKTSIQQRYVRFREALEAGDRALIDLARIQSGDEWFVKVAEKPKFPDNWTDFLPEIIDASRDVARSIGLGVGKTKGRYPKLLAALVLRTTGQEVSTESIYDHLPAKGG